MSKRQTNIDWDFSSAKLTNVGVPSANGHVMRYDEFGATNWNQMTTAGIPRFSGLSLVSTLTLLTITGTGITSALLKFNTNSIDRWSIGCESASSAFSFYNGTNDVLQISQAGLISKYNNIATVSGGVPSILATVDLTSQTAAKTATTIYTPTATGLFRISAYLQVTTSSGIGGVLGGATGVVITFTDGDGSVAQSITIDTSTNAGTPSLTANSSTTANLNGEIIIYAKTGVAIQYAIGYTGGSSPAMAYSAHLKVEAL